MKLPGEQSELSSEGFTFNAAHLVLHSYQLWQSFWSGWVKCVHAWLCALDAEKADRRSGPFIGHLVVVGTVVDEHMCNAPRTNKVHIVLA